MNKHPGDFATPAKKQPSNTNELERLRVHYVPIDTLQPDPVNPRQHSDKQIRQIAQSLRSFGFNVPILIDQQGKVIAGHARLQASRLLGLKNVPTICLGHLRPNELRAFMIADNKLSENSAWNPELLGAQLKALSEVELDFDLEATGFEMAEIDLLIEGLSPAVEQTADPADDVPKPVGQRVSRLNDEWMLGHHRISCGDSRDPNSYLLLMDGRKANLVITDPPYKVRIAGHASGLGAIQHRDFQMAAGEMSEGEFTDFLVRVFNHLALHSVDGCLHYIFMDWRHASEILTAGKQAYTQLKNVIVWVKDNGGMGSLYRSQHELIFLFKNGTESHRNNVQLGQFGRYRTNVWNYAGVNSFSRSTEEGNLLELHPTVKPVALVADAIMDCSARGDMVLDPFLGSGTTLIAAERTGRICRGIELDPGYLDTVIRRWQKFTGLLATHARSGRTFKEIEQEASDEHGQ